MTITTQHVSEGVLQNGSGQDYVIKLGENHFNITLADNTLGWQEARQSVNAVIADCEADDMDRAVVISSQDLVRIEHEDRVYAIVIDGVIITTIVELD